MGKIVLDISMSLDGFIASLHDSPENPLGDGGMRLHKWIWGDKNEGSPGDGAIAVNREAVHELMNTTGAVVTGRRTYDIVHCWGGTHPVNGVPVFVLSEDIPKEVPKGKSTFTFVTDGVANAIGQARVAAGAKDVYVLGGANVVQQCIEAGLLD